MASSSRDDVDTGSPTFNDRDLTELELRELATKLYPEDYLRLGARLGFEDSKLSHFKYDHPNNIEGALSTMLIRWRRNEIGAPCSIRQRLADAFKGVKRLDLSQMVYLPNLQEDVLPTFGDISLTESASQNEGSGNAEWRLDKTILLPVDKAERMKACIALTGRRVAVGYRSGSVDIINIDNEQKKRILTDLKIRSLTQLNDGTMIVCNDDTKDVKVYKCIQTGQHVGVRPLYAVRQCGKHRSLSVDPDDNVYLGLRGFKQIEVIDGSNGVLKKTIKTDVDPWSIAIMRTGHIAVTNSLRGTEDAVTILSKEGEVVSRMPGVKDARQFIAVDSKDSIYVAIKAKNGRVTIRKYTGHVVEVVTEGLESVMKPREWVQLTCLSPSELVMCDAKSMFVFKKH